MIIFLKYLLLLVTFLIPSWASAYLMGYGNFTGNGTSQSITSLSFTPKVVILKTVAANDRWTWCTNSTQPNICTSHENSAQITTNDCVTAFSSTGFSVGANTWCNNNADAVYWVAFAEGSDNDFVAGTFVGNGTTTTLSTGWQAKFVVCRSDSSGRSAFIKTSDMAGNDAQPISTSFDTGSTVTLNATDIQFQGNCNASGTNIVYYAFKSGVDSVAAGSYAGTDTAPDDDNRNISTGTSNMTPKYGVVKSTNTTLSSFRFPTQVGDSTMVHNGAPAADRIQSFGLNTFQVGASASVNEATFTHHWFMVGDPQVATKKPRSTIFIQ